MPISLTSGDITTSPVTSQGATSGLVTTSEITSGRTSGLDPTTPITSGFQSTSGGLTSGLFTETFAPEATTGVTESNRKGETIGGTIGAIALVFISSKLQIVALD